MAIIFLFISTFGFSQDVKGTILEIVENKETPVVGANIYWIDNSGGAISDIDGKFKLSNPDNKNSYVVSFVGYQNDTLSVVSSDTKIILKANAELDAVSIRYNTKSSSVSLLSSANVLNISSDELLKAACCNLAESFETTPSIDVNFSDGISGRKQINMLGLSSPNILMSIENIPSIRGALQSYGLTYIPGTWIESLQVAKGSGSVVNGYESISGQINAELRKPLTDDKFFLNLFANQMERLELNTHYTANLSQKLDYGLYFHVNKKDTSADNNNDGFRDDPTGKQLNILNRFQYTNLVYNSIIGNINNKIKTGISISYDEYDEYVNNLGFNDFDISRIEKSVGAYFEYNYDNSDKINLSAGIRFDNHNKIGNFISPRFHMNYMVLPKSTIKFSFGKATRLANIFSENQKLFYSSREIIFTENSLPSDFSSMKADQAWNYGVSIINSFKLFGKESQLILDYYITDFENKVVADWETPTQINFYNLTGKSFSNSFQAQFSHTLSNSIDLLFAYKNTVAETDYSSHGRLKNPLTPSDRIFFNVAYDGPTNDKGRNWKCDFTFNHVGKQRVPSTQNNPSEYRLSGTS